MTRQAQAYKISPIKHKSSKATAPASAPKYFGSGSSFMGSEMQRDRIGTRCATPKMLLAPKSKLALKRFFSAPYLVNPYRQDCPDWRDRARDTRRSTSIEKRIFVHSSGKCGPVALFEKSFLSLRPKRADDPKRMMMCLWAGRKLVPNYFLLCSKMQ